MTARDPLASSGGTRQSMSLVDASSRRGKGEEEEVRKHWHEDGSVMGEPWPASRGEGHGLMREEDERRRGSAGANECEERGCGQWNHWQREITRIICRSTAAAGAVVAHSVPSPDVGSRIRCLLSPLLSLSPPHLA